MIFISKTNLSQSLGVATRVVLIKQQTFHFSILRSFLRITFDLSRFHKNISFLTAVLLLLEQIKLTDALFYGCYPEKKKFIYIYRLYTGCKRQV